MYKYDILHLMKKKPQKKKKKKPKPKPLKFGYLVNTSYRECSFPKLHLARTPGLAQP